MIQADEKLLGERAAWLESLGAERRLSGNTLEAYERDTRQFLQFLSTHVGGMVKIRDIEALRAAIAALTTLPSVCTNQ